MTHLLVSSVYNPWTPEIMLNFDSVYVNDDFHSPQCLKDLWNENKSIQFK